MNRWVLLEHKVSAGNSVDIHFDFLIEQKLDCLTWKLLEIPSLEKDFVEISKQPNHRLVWLSRKEYNLSRNRGHVKRIDNGTYINVSSKLDSQEINLIVDGIILKGFMEISGNLCRLTKNI